MAWYNTLHDVLLGGTSKQPGSFYTPFNHESTIMGAVNQGLGANQAAPQVALDNPFRSGQMQQMGQLQRIASGQQQGAGELAAQRQAANAMAQQQAMARMQRGGNAALGYQNAANNSARIGLAGAGQAQQAAMQDQMNAQGLLSSALGQGRGQDLNALLANQNANLQQQGINNQMRLGNLSALTGMDQATLAAQMAQYQAAQGKQGLLGPLLSMGGQLGAAYLTGGAKPPA